MKRALLYGSIGGALIALLKVIEYQYFVRTLPAEVYGGLIALIFTVAGIYAGLRLRRPHVLPAAPAVEPPAPLPTPFENPLTPREHEILLLIAEGLSNREIGERLFVSENTVKTHSSRLFEKLGVNRRVQAVQKGRELGLVR